MSRVLIPADASWYHELKAVAYYSESDLERTIRQHIKSLFPDFHVFPFKRDVASRSTGEVKKPDLAMIRKDFSAWGIIEVEICEHDVRHVLAQTSVFKDGDYNAPEVAEYIQIQMRKHCKKNASMKRLTDLISSELPSVMVIVDAEVDDWQTQLSDSGVDICIFETFKSTRGRYVYRTVGNYPVVSAQEVHCRRHPSKINVLELIGDFTFRKLRKNREVDIVFDMCLTRWVVFENDGAKYLHFLGSANPLPANATYRLFADRSHRYYFAIN